VRVIRWVAILALLVLGTVLVMPSAPPPQPVVDPVAGLATLTGAVPLPASAPAPPPTPAPTHRVLAVKIDYQDHALSCEAAALKMALAYEGITVDELTLMRYMSLDLRPAGFDSHGHLIAWGDPAKAYVGNPDGVIQSYTGYGVYDTPLARAAIRAGAHVVRFGSGLYGTGIPPSAIYQAVLEGHPVVAWISNTYHDVSLDRYTAFDGATVWYTLTEHAVTIVGVRPGAVLINDPWFGRGWHTKAQFESAYSTFGHMAVVLGR
jgi:uncharacterized protein YvpB